MHVIDKYTQIQTCPFSNLVLGSVMDYQDITFNVNKNLEAKFHTTQVKYINSEKKRIYFSDDMSMNYDYLILSPGIGFKKNQINGYSIDDKSSVPHCWTGDKKILEFKKRLNSLDDFCNLIISAPEYPYRCPPSTI